MTTMAEIRQMKANYDKALRDNGREALGTLFKEFFAAHGDVLAVSWTQYTPHWNDGDACTFHVRDFSYALASAGAEDSYLTVEIDGKTVGLVESYDLPEAMRPELQAFETVATDDDLYEALFGNGVRVVATRAGFAVEEYEHD